MAATSFEIDPHAPAFPYAQPIAHAESACPCGSGHAYGNCCGPLHAGIAHASTPEALMRSRYCAFALGLEQYLCWTWAEETCPERLELDPAQVWTRLRILAAPVPTDGTGVVHFRAHYRYGTQRDRLEEVSTFEIRNGRWVYVDGQIEE